MENQFRFLFYITLHYTISYCVVLYCTTLLYFYFIFQHELWRKNCVFNWIAPPAGQAARAPYVQTFPLTSVRTANQAAAVTQQQQQQQREEAEPELAVLTAPASRRNTNDASLKVTPTRAPLSSVLKTGLSSLVTPENRPQGAGRLGCCFWVSGPYGVGTGGLSVARVVPHRVGRIACRPTGPPRTGSLTCRAETALRTGNRPPAERLTPTDLCPPSTTAAPPSTTAPRRRAPRAPGRRSTCLSPRRTSSGSSGSICTTLGWSKYRRGGAAQPPAAGLSADGGRSESSCPNQNQLPELATEHPAEPNTLDADGDTF